MKVLLLKVVLQVIELWLYLVFYSCIYFSVVSVLRQTKLFPFLTSFSLHVFPACSLSGSPSARRWYVAVQACHGAAQVRHLEDSRA